VHHTQKNLLRHNTECSTKIKQKNRARGRARHFLSKKYSENVHSQNSVRSRYSIFTVLVCGDGVWVCGSLLLIWRVLRGLSVRLTGVPLPCWPAGGSLERELPASCL